MLVYIGAHRGRTRAWQISPTITGTHNSDTTDGKPIAAFTGVTVSDPIAGATETLKFFGVAD